MDTKTTALLNAKFASDYASKTAIANTIDGELAQFKQLMDSKQEGLAVAHGEAMLKLLNSSLGPDAISGEETRTLGKYLQKFQNPFDDGSFYGADLDKFYSQLTAKSNALKAAAAESLKMSGQLRESGVGGLGGPKKDLTMDDHLYWFNWAQNHPDDPKAKLILEAQKKLRQEQ